MVALCTLIALSNTSVATGHSLLGTDERIGCPERQTHPGNRGCIVRWWLSCPLDKPGAPLSGLHKRVRAVRDLWGRQYDICDTNRYIVKAVGNDIAE